MKKKINEASVEEGQRYMQFLTDQFDYVVPAIEKAVSKMDADFNVEVKPSQGKYIDMLNAACSIAYYVQQNCKDQGLCEMAKNIVQLGAGYMI